MRRRRAILRFILWEFGPLVALLALSTGNRWCQSRLVVIVSTTQGRRGFFLCRWPGALPVVDEPRSS